MHHNASASIVHRHQRHNIARRSIAPCLLFARTSTSDITDVVHQDASSVGVNLNATTSFILPCSLGVPHTV